MTTTTSVTIDDVRAAAERVAGHALRTPTLPAVWAGGDLWLKAENLQPMGAFKIRGATNAISRIDPETRHTGVVAHSSGNHAQAIAWAAREFGIPAAIAMPDVAPTVKVEATRALGADVILIPGAERESAAAEIRDERGMTLISPFDHPDVIAGQGTLALEFLEDLADVDTVLVPVGGGGLISGVGVTVKALSPSTRVVGVEPELAADVREGLSAGHRVEWSAELTYRTIADGVRTPLVGEITFPLIQATVNEVVTVSEAAILAAVGTTARRAHLVAEPSGVLGIAAYLADPARFGRTVAVVSGGNVDPAILARAVTS